MKDTLHSQFLMMTILKPIVKYCLPMIILKFNKTNSTFTIFNNLTIRI